MTHTDAGQHDASLHFVAGQLLFEYLEGGAVIRKCISPESASTAFSSTGVDSDWLPEHVCRYGVGQRGPWLLLRFAPGRYDLPLVDPLSPPGGGEPITLLSVPMPGLLFLGCNTHYYIWAYKQWKLAATKLFRAPLANVYTDGSICFGNVHPRAAHGSTIAATWRLFWESRFSDHLANQKSKTQPDNVLHMLAHIQSLGVQTYPLNDLVPAQNTIPNIIRHLMESERD